MKKNTCHIIVSAISTLLIMACSPAPQENEVSDESPIVVEQPAQFSVDYEKFTLDNGLEVVFHTDRSDPVVAVALTVHVGSSREKPQRTGVGLTQSPKKGEGLLRKRGGGE